MTLTRGRARAGTPSAGASVELGPGGQARPGSPPAGGDGEAAGRDRGGRDPEGPGEGAGRPEGADEGEAALTGAHYPTPAAGSPLHGAGPGPAATVPSPGGLRRTGRHAGIWEPPPGRRRRRGVTQKES